MFNIKEVSDKELLIELENRIKIGGIGIINVDGRVVSLSTSSIPIGNYKEVSFYTLLNDKYSKTLWDELIKENEDRNTNWQFVSWVEWKVSRGRVD